MVEKRYGLIYAKAPSGYNYRHPVLRSELEDSTAPIPDAPNTIQYQLYFRFDYKTLILLLLKH